MFGNVTSLVGLHVTGKYRTEACSTDASGMRLGILTNGLVNWSPFLDLEPFPELEPFWRELQPFRELEPFSRVYPVLQSAQVMVVRGIGKSYESDRESNPE